jgi:hypothetical protein
VLRGLGRDPWHPWRAQAERRPAVRWKRGARASLALLALLLAAPACDAERSDGGPEGPLAGPLLPYEGPLHPGTYVIARGAPAYVEPLRITFDVAGRGWEAWSAGVVKRDADEPHISAVAFADVTNVYADPCRNAGGLLQPPVGPSVDDLAAALQALPGLEVVVPARPAALGGFSGTYLELQVDPELDLTTCDGGSFDSWVAENANRYHQGRGQLEEFWILDVQGTRLVVNASHFPETPPRHLEQLRALVDSIRIEV